MDISHTKSFRSPGVSIALATLAHMMNVYEICLNTTNYPIFNMQDFIYYLWTPILDCFGQLVSPPCTGRVRQVPSSVFVGHKSPAKGDNNVLFSVKDYVVITYQCHYSSYDKCAHSSGWKSVVQPWNYDLYLDTFVGVIVLKLYMMTIIFSEHIKLINMKPVVILTVWHPKENNLQEQLHVSTSNNL